ncbi:TPA: hypothetical protein ACHP1R_002508, partial [Raoultella ornithinolytica]
TAVKPFSEIENTMNGSLVIPKLICIKFYRLFFNHAITGDIKKARRIHIRRAGGREQISLAS